MNTNRDFAAEYAAAYRATQTADTLGGREFAGEMMDQILDAADEAGVHFYCSDVIDAVDRELGNVVAADLSY